MIHPYVDPARQGNGLVGRSEIYTEQQVYRTTVGLEQHHQREPSVEPRETTEPATLTQRPEHHLEEQHLQGLSPASSKQHQQRYFEMTALEQQLQQYCAAEAIQRQRLLDVDLNRSRMLERFQLARIIRSKEAAAQVEALDRRMQQHEAEAAWRSQRNSYLRGVVFDVLHSVCARSPMLKDSNFPPVVLSSKTSTYSPGSSEPFHPQLLALRYKQEMTALLQQQQAVYRHRHQGECHTSSECAKPDSVSPSSCSGNAQVSSSTTAHVPGGTRHAQGKHSLRTQGSLPSKAHLAQSTTQEPPESCPAAPRLPTTTDASTTSAGAMFPSRISRCFSTETTVPHVGMSATAPHVNSTARVEFPRARPANDVRSAPARLSAVSSATACPPAQAAPSSQKNPSYEKSLVHITEGTAAGNGGCSALAASPAAEEKNVLDAEAAVHPCIRVEENVAGKASNDNASNGEAMTRPRSTAVTSARVAEQSPDPHQPANASRANQRNLEWQASVKNEACNEWMSPEIPTEKPSRELLSCNVL